MGRMTVESEMGILPFSFIYFLAYNLDLVYWNFLGGGGMDAATLL